jgi:hypothetical protein
MAVSAKLLGHPNLTYADIEKPKVEAGDSETAVAKKSEKYRQERQKVQTRVQWTLTLFPPLLFAAFGIGRWRRREAGRAKVKL